MMRRVRARGWVGIAAILVVPVVLSGCSVLEVQTWFAIRGASVSMDEARAIAEKVNAGNPGACDLNYAGGCIPDNQAAVHCIGLSGDGPAVVGPLTISGWDHFGLDPDRDGRACEGRSPMGVLDVATASADRSRLVVEGWALEPDNDAPIEVHVYDNGVGRRLVAQDVRDDLIPFGVGPGHGFRGEWPTSSGVHIVCAYGINVGGGTNTLLGCEHLDIPASVEPLTTTAPPTTAPPTTAPPLPPGPTSAQVFPTSDSTHGPRIVDVSPDGRYVLGISERPNVVPARPDLDDSAAQLYLRDVVAGTSTLLSIGSDGHPLDRDVGEATLSADGRHVTYTSIATNRVTAGDGHFTVHLDRLTGTARSLPVDRAIELSDDGHVLLTAAETGNAPGTFPRRDDFYTYDLTRGTLQRVARSTSGDEANEVDPFYRLADLSGDGRSVAFISVASNLVPGDTNDRSDAFVRRLDTGTTVRVSVDDQGRQIESGSSFVSIDATGTLVAFSASGQIRLGDPVSYEVFSYVRDLTAGTIRPASWDFSPGGRPSPTIGAYEPVISADGRRVAYTGRWPDQVSGTVVADLPSHTVMSTFGHPCAPVTSFRLMDATGEHAYCGNSMWSYELH